MSHTILIEGRQAFFTGFGKLADRFQDYRKTLEKIGDETYLIVQKRFQSGADWPPVTRATEARKAKRHHGPSRVLVDTKALMESFAESARGNIHRVNRLEGEFGSGVPYGIYHQEGRGVPRRKIIDMTGRDESRFTEIVLDDLKEDFESYGFKVS